ncbi:hypothetical protein DRP04_09640 [Archaeoglobales archaeon]|nr:MAG: hypothetical protein DRP04_09640 [Archaeoglobales archaeon]
MGTLTIVLSEEIEEELRKVVRKIYGAKKGNLSKFIEDAIRNYIHSLRKGEVVYRAYKDDKLVAEAKSLEELVKLLRERDIEVRGLRIIRSDLKRVGRAGYRLRT